MQASPCYIISSFIAFDMVMAKHDHAYEMEIITIFDCILLAE